MKFRKKPIEIEAVQVLAADYNGQTFDGAAFSETPDWLIDAIKSEVIGIEPADYDYAIWRVGTLEDGPNGQAKHVAVPGDWIIRGVKGELYPIKPDIFAATYDAA